MSRGRHRAPRRNAAFALVDDWTADWIDPALKVFAVLALAVLIVFAVVISHAGAATPGPSPAPTGGSSQPPPPPPPSPAPVPPQPTPVPVPPPAPSPVPVPVPTGLTPAQIAAQQAAKAAALAAHQAQLAQLAAQRKAAHVALLAQVRAQKLAAKLAHRQALLAIRARKAAVQAQRRAAQFAHGQVVVNAFWTAHGRPEYTLEVALNKVYWARGGRLVGMAIRPVGPLSAAWLANNVPNSWVERDGKAVRLHALLVVGDGSTLTVNKSDLTALELADGSGIWVTRGTFAVNGVTLTSADSHGQPLTPDDRNRPFVRAGQHASILLDDATVIGLGNAANPDNAGVTWGKGATGHARNVIVRGNLDGLRMAGSTSVQLDHVQVSGSRVDGVALAYDTGTTMTSITSRDNGGDGVSLSHEMKGRTLDGITASGNGAWGIDTFAAANVVIRNASTSNDRAGGIRLADCQSCSAVDSTTNGDHVGVGVMNSTAVLTHLQVRGGDEGIHLYRGSHNVTLGNVAISGAKSGISIGKGVTAVLLDHPVIHGSGKSALSNHSVDLVLLGGNIDGGGVGVATDAAMTMSDTRITGVGEGIHVTGGARVDARRAYILAGRLGIHVQDSRLDLTDSTVYAILGIKGNIVLHGKCSVSLPPFPWLGFVAIGAILAAFLLEAIHATRQPRRKSAQYVIPDHVLNVR